MRSIVGAYPLPLTSLSKTNYPDQLYTPTESFAIADRPLAPEMRSKIRTILPWMETLMSAQIVTHDSIIGVLSGTDPEEIDRLHAIVRIMETQRNTEVD